MPVWNQLVDILRESIIAYAQVCHGNLGWGILLVTFLARLALMPLGIRLARAAHIQQSRMQRIQPALDALRVKHKGDSQRLAEETRRLLQREGISLMPAGALGSIVQIPVFLALYSAVRQVAILGGRFAWIRDIARPDPLVMVLVTGLTVAATIAGPAPSSANQIVMILFSAVVTAVVLSKMAAGIGLYLGPVDALRRGSGNGCSTFNATERSLTGVCAARTSQSTNESRAQMITIRVCVAATAAALLGTIGYQPAAGTMSLELACQRNRVGSTTAVRVAVRNGTTVPASIVAALVFGDGTEFAAPGLVTSIQASGQLGGGGVAISPTRTTQRGCRREGRAPACRRCLGGLARMVFRQLAVRFFEDTGSLPGILR